jgi:hypothetical protein
MLMINLKRNSTHALQGGAQWWNQQLLLRGTGKYNDTSKYDKYIHKCMAQQLFNIFTHVISIHNENTLLW